MLYDWNIKHLHLHIPRHGDDLLFCIITDRILHIITVGNHNQFEDEKLYETAYKNWPELFIELSGMTPETLTREQRKSLRGQFGERAAINVLTGIGGKAIVPRTLSGLTTSGHPMNGETFLAYTEQILLPALRPDDVVVMDNLSTHKTDLVQAAFKRSAIHLLYLPPYSPDLNGDVARTTHLIADVLGEVFG